MKISRIILIFFTMLFCQAFAIEEVGNKSVFYLDDCIQYAIVHSPVIKKAKLNYEIAKNNHKIAKSAYFPTLGTSLNYYQYINSDKRYDDGYSKNLLPDFSVYLQQLIYDFGKTGSNINMYDFYKIATKYQYDDVVNETVSDIKMAYFTVLEAQAAVDVEKNNLYINERIVEATKNLFEGNKKSETDYIDAKVHLIEAQMSLTDAKNALDVALADLCSKMYFDEKSDLTIKEISEFYYIDAYFLPEFIKKVDGNYVYKRAENVPVNEEVIYDAQIKDLPFTLDEAYDLAYKNNPKLKALENTKEAMRHRAKHVKRDYFPEIRAKVGYNRDDKHISQVDDIHNNQLNIAVTLNSAVNIMQKKNEIKNANYLIESAESDIEAYKKNVYYDIKKSYMDVETAQKQIISAKEKIQKAMENLEATRNAYLSDEDTKVGYLELQNARKGYNAAKLEYISRLRFYNNCLADLQKNILMYDATDILKKEN